MSRTWMPMYWGDYFKNTRDLTTLQHGAYLLLIAHYWEHAGLPTDERRLATIAGISFQKWKSIAGPIAAKFQANWKHQRLDDEILKGEHIKAQRLIAGRKGGQNSQSARAILQANYVAKSMVGPEQLVEQLANHSHSHKKESKKVREQEDSITPSGVSTTYAFESGIIRLNQKNLDQWVAAFSELDVTAELIGMTSWADQQGARWFPAVSAALAKRNREIKAGKKQESSDDRRPHAFRPQNGFGAALEELNRSIAEDKARADSGGKAGGRPTLRLLPNGGRS